MNRTKIAFMALTALFALGMLPGAIMNIAQPDMVLEMVGKLGLPLHLLTLMGVWKLMGIVALANPRFAKINEWAYAGFFFDLSGAAYLHAAIGDFAGIAPPIVLLTLLVASYVSRNRFRAMGPIPAKAQVGAAVPVNA